MSLTTNRIIEITEGPTYLHVHLNQLLIERDGELVGSVPLEDVAVLVLATRAVTLTHSVLSGLAAGRAVVITCDERMTPCSMAVPLVGNQMHPRRLRVQLRVSRPRCKRLWQQIVRAKISAQARCLERLGRPDVGLRSLCARVGSGDPKNVEAEAARRYWPALMGSEFHRSPEGGDPANVFLNYGYSILRAAVARAVVAGGLHPALGIHHHNRENSFALADDLMEPVRPTIDERVVRLFEVYGSGAVLSKATKSFLLQVLVERYLLEGQERTLFDCLASLVGDLVAALEGAEIDLRYPETIATA